MLFVFSVSEDTRVFLGAQMWLLRLAELATLTTEDLTTFVRRLTENRWNCKIVRTDERSHAG